MNDWVAEHLTRVPLLQKILFIDHLRIMLHAGLSLLESLTVLQKETVNKKLRIMIEELMHDVEAGRTLSSALLKYPRTFPPMYVKMIAAGETAGALDESLQQVVVQMKKTYELTSAVRGAMLYPAIIITAMVGIGIMVMTVVLPQLLSLFKEFDAKLPLSTRILIAVSDVLSNPVTLALVFAAAALLIALFMLLMKRVPLFQAKIHRFLLALPIIGRMIQYVNLARFSLTLSSLLHSSIPVVEAVTITAGTCGNVNYGNRLRSAAGIVQKGQPLSGALVGDPKLFPPMVTEMIAVGERSGEMEQMLGELSNFYNTEVNKLLKNFTSVIEPLIIIVIGIAVAGLAVAVVMPMFALVQQF